MAIVQFEERKSGSPEAIHSWFYPGENTGWQFIYPKEETLTSMNTTAPAAPADTPAPDATAAAALSVPPEPQAEDEATRPEEVAAVILGLQVLGWFTLPAGIHVYLFELGLVATLQAFIFATLCAIYLGGAVTHH